MLTVSCFKHIVRMYRAFKGALEERLKFKEEKNRDGTVRTITQGIHLITTVLILFLFLSYNFVCSCPVHVYVQT